jgi:hypothetical protein
MKTKFAIRLVAILTAMTLNAALVHAQSPTPGKKAATESVSPAAGSQLPVVGSGTLGRLTKWTGFTSSNSVIGDTSVFEDKYGRVGIGTTTPTSLLTVAGTIESTSGGFKFPDGTLQTTSQQAHCLPFRTTRPFLGMALQPRRYTLFNLSLCSILYQPACLL